MPNAAKAFIFLVITAGASVLFYSVSTWSPLGLPAFGAFLALTLFASTLKTRIPGVNGTISPSFAFLLVGITSFRFSEVVLAAFAAALVQCLWRPKQRLQLVQVLFSAATLPLSCAVSFWFSHAVVRYLGSDSSLALVILAGCVYFPLNSAMVSVVIALVAGQPVKQIFVHCYDYVFAYFMGGIFFAGLVSGAYIHSSAWKGAVLLTPAAALAHFYFFSSTCRNAPQSSPPTVEQDDPVEVLV